MLEVKMEGMGDEKYIRKGGCCPCKHDNEWCNFCKFEPKYPSKHKHKFFYIKTIVKKRFFGLIKKVIIINRCPCGEYGNEMVK